MGRQAGGRGLLVSLRRASFFLMFFLLSGCTEVLYSGLTEKEGNEMLSILLAEGIQAEKTAEDKGKSVALLVPKSDLSKAIQVLKSRGYPRDNFDSVGALFKKEGLISSPLEERARYIYGLSQELSATLSQLDGVLTARVHVVIPESENKRSAVEHPSASVFIKHAASVNIDDFVPQIKMLVNNGIEGLSYDRISVALFPTQINQRQSAHEMTNMLSITMSKSSVSSFYVLLLTGATLLGLAVVGNVVLYRRLEKSKGRMMSVN